MRFAFFWVESSQQNRSLSIWFYSLGWPPPPSLRSRAIVVCGHVLIEFHGRLHFNEIIIRHLGMGSSFGLAMILPPICVLNPFLGHSPFLLVRSVVVVGCNGWIFYDPSIKPERAWDDLILALSPGEIDEEHERIARMNIDEKTIPSSSSMIGKPRQKGVLGGKVAQTPVWLCSVLHSLGVKEVYLTRGKRTSNSFRQFVPKSGFSRLPD